MVGTTTGATPTRISGEDHHNQILSCLVRTNTSGQIHFGATATSSHASNERSDPPCSGKAGRLLSAACTPLHWARTIIRAARPIIGAATRFRRARHEKHAWGLASGPYPRPDSTCVGFPRPQGAVTAIT